MRVKDKDLWRMLTFKGEIEGKEPTKETKKKSSES